MVRYPQTWVEGPIFDSGAVAKRRDPDVTAAVDGFLKNRPVDNPGSDGSLMTVSNPKPRDPAVTAMVDEFLKNRPITRPTAEERRASLVRANKRKEGPKHIHDVLTGWDSHRAARALPNAAEIQAIEARNGTYTQGGQGMPLGERGDTRVTFPKEVKIPEPVAVTHEPIILPGRCANCAKPIPSKMLARGARFCSKNCAQTHRRRRQAKAEANRVFAPVPVPTPVELERRPTLCEPTPIEYFQEWLDREKPDYWAVRKAEDEEEERKKAESEAALEALEKWIPKPVVTRRNEASKHH
jgi:hypothetical protein